MNTELFVITQGVEPTVLERVVPPACRTPAERRAPADTAGDEWIIEARPWRLRHPARHFLPSLSLLAPVPSAFRFELAIESAGAWSPWVAAAAIGADGLGPSMPDAPTLSCDVDVFTSTVPAERVRLRVRGRTPEMGFATMPWIVALSACDLAPLERVTGPEAPIAIAVPPRSQMVEAEDVRMHICSPTSVAMVLERWGRRVDTAAFAADVFQPALARFGVWPAAIAAAARHGVAGYLLRFPDWASAAWCLAAELPIVASVRYGPGELAGAAMAETDGHLVVLTGADGDDVLLNDPAAPTPADVPRRVRRTDLEHAWLARTGIGYVFFDPGGTAATGA